MVAGLHLPEHAKGPDAGFVSKPVPAAQVRITLTAELGPPVQILKYPGPVLLLELFFLFLEHFLFFFLVGF